MPGFSARFAFVTPALACSASMPLPWRPGYAGEATLGKGDLTATGESLYVKDYK